MEQIQDKPKNKELQEKFIVLQIENEKFIISLEYVSEIVRVQNVTEAPHQPAWVKGIMNLRNSVISLVDTRKRLGIESFIEKMHILIENAKMSHLNWSQKLEESIVNHIPFNLPLDSTKCDFGKNVAEILARPTINAQIKKKIIETNLVHTEVHNAAKEALELMEKGNKELATEKIKEIKNIFIPSFFNVLDELNTFTHSIEKDIAVIIEYNGYNFAMLADDITKMKTFKPDNRQKCSLTDNPFIFGIFDDDEGLYQELDLKGILTGKNDEMLIEVNNQEN